MILWLIKLLGEVKHGGVEGRYGGVTLDHMVDRVVTRNSKVVMMLKRTSTP